MVGITWNLSHPVTKVYIRIYIGNRAPLPRSWFHIKLWTCAYPLIKWYNIDACEPIFDYNKYVVNMKNTFVVTSVLHVSKSTRHVEPNGLTNGFSDTLYTTYNCTNLDIWYIIHCLGVINVVLICIKQIHL